MLTATGDNGAQDTPPAADPNELETEMSDQELDAFVNNQLGLENPTSGEQEPAAPTPQVPATPPEEPGQGEQQPSAPTTPTAEPVAAPPEPQLPEEITAPSTDDLWIEVEQVRINEDGEQVVEAVKLVYDPNNPDTFVPDNFMFKDDKQLMGILEAKAEITRIYNERQNEYETQVKQQEEAAQAQAKQTEQLAQWDAEVDDLIADGFMEAPTLNPDDKNYRDDPANKKIESVYNFMTKENEKRVSEGLPPISSFAAAFHKLQHQEQQEEQVQQQKVNNAVAKQKGALVGGSSAASGGSSQPTYVAGSAGSIYDVPIDV